MYYLVKRILIALVFIIVLVGCGNNSSSNNSPSIPSLNMATENVNESTSPYVDPTEQISTEAALPTPKPTLIIEDATNLIIQSLDSQCILPCFLGVTPGISVRQEVISFYDAVSSLVSKNWLDDSTESGSVALSLPTSNIVFSIEYQYEGDIVDYVYVQTLKRDTAIGGETDYNNSEYLSRMKKFSLGSVLDSFGSPEEVYIKSYSISPTWFRTHFLLYFPDIGILMDYESENDLLIVDDEYWVTTCPSEGFINFRLFAPGDEKSIVELLEPYDRIENYQALEDVTNFTLDGFVETFSSSGSSCDAEVQTLMELWPED